MARPTAVSMAKFAKPKDALPAMWEALLSRERRLEKALTVKPERRPPAGPTTQQLVEARERPRVFARVRPLLKQEFERGAGYLEGLRVCTQLLTSDGGSGAEGREEAASDGAAPLNGVQAFQDGASREPIRGFDGVFGVDADNRKVFQAAVEPALPSVMSGSGVSVFCCASPRIDPLWLHPPAAPCR